MLDIQLKSNILQVLFQSKQLAIAVIDKELKWSEWSKGMVDYSGLPSEFVLGKKADDLFNGFASTKHFDFIYKILNGELKEEGTFNGPGFWPEKLSEYCFVFVPLKNEEDQTEGCIILIKKIEYNPEIEKDKVYKEYKTLAENSGIGIWRMDREGFTEYVNPSMCEILGIKSLEEIKGQKIEYFFTKESLEKMSQEYYKRLNNISSTYEVELIRPDGTTRNAMIHGSPLVNKEGKTEGLISTILDITESKLSQKGLIRSEKRFRSLFEQTLTPTGISRNGIVILANQALADLFRYETKESLVGKSLLDFLIPDQRPISEELIQKRMNGEKVPHYYEHTGLRKDGTTFEFQLMISFIDFPDGIATMLSLKDVSEQKKAEKAIRESEAKFRGIFEASIVGVMFADGQGKIIDANKRFLEMIGYSQEDLEKGELSWQKLTPPEYFTRDFEAANEVVEKGYISPYEKEYIKKDGLRIPVLITSSLIRNPSTKYGVGFVVDLTDLKKSQEETVKVANELSTFLYMASHDLKGPLASVIGLTNIAQREIYDSKALEYLNLIRECTMKLDTSLMNFLKIIRIKNNIFDNSLINFYELTSNIISSLKHQDAYEEVSFTISVNIKKEFYSDEDLIRSILQNLLENAVKYKTRLRTPEVKITIEETEHDLLIKVEDNGRGIDEKIKDKIYNIFYRGDISSKGSGLGLYIVKTASENLKGSVSVANKPAGGCVFTVCLPFLNS